MPSIVVVGAQWGNEGKGKIVDLLPRRSKYRHLVRAQGGHDEGHHVNFEGKEIRLRLLPQGILDPHTFCYLGAGMMIDPRVLVKEIEEVENLGVQIKGRLFISELAHIIFPYHQVLEFAKEKRRAQPIGSGGFGVDPCYIDKVNHGGVRMGELIRPNLLKKILSRALAVRNIVLRKIYDTTTFEFEPIFTTYSALGEKLSPYVTQVESLLDKAQQKDEMVIFEATHGTFFDVDFGTYPFVSCAHTTASGVLCGAGVGPSSIDHVLGVVKAFTSPRGNIEIPTQLTEQDEIIDREKKRLGWFDVMQIKESIRLNGIDSLALTKLDLLDELSEIKICIGYKLNGNVCSTYPRILDEKDQLEPIYETFPGWKPSLRHITLFEALPETAKHYIRCLESLCGVPISILSLGPKRECSVIMRDLLTIQPEGAHVF